MLRNKRQIPHFLFLLLVGLCFVAACSGDEPDTPRPREQPDLGEPDLGDPPDGLQSQVFLMDQQLTPRVPTVAGIDGGPPRPVVAVAAARQTDFVEHEIVVRFDDAAQVDAIADRWNGEVLFTIDGGSTDPGGIALLRIDPETVDPDEIDGRFTDDQLDALPEHRVSSLGAIRTILAAAIESTDHGHPAAINYVGYGQAITRRESLEAADGPTDYVPNAFEWPYMSRGSAQDAGVAEAWRLLAEADRLENRTTVVIADGGFRRHADLPDDVEIHPERSWDIENPAECTGGTQCEWHGTKVAQVAFGKADNGYGVAGSGAPVARGLLLQAPSTDFASIVRYVREAVGIAADHGGRTVVNMSGGSSIAAGVCLTGACSALDQMTALLRSQGLLLVAAAGNEGVNVDRRDCTLWGAVCWEEEIWAPCELSGVLCVGGLRWDSSSWHPASNWSGDRDDCCTVDLWTSIGFYMAPDPADGSEAVQNVTGTSYSSPFVAGIAALVWAAAPAFDDEQVERVLLQTAHRRPTSRSLLHVNAYEAVRMALGGDAPPWVEIVTPTDGERIGGHVAVSLEAVVEDDSEEWSIEWASDLDGPIGGAATFTSAPDLSVGLHTITATVSDGRWQVSDSVEVQIASIPPTVEILVPEEGATFYQSEPIVLNGRTFDADLGTSLPEAAVWWLVDGEFVGRTPSQRIDGGRLSVGPHRIGFVGDDGTDRVGTEIGIVVEEDPPVLPPTAVITQPTSGSTFLADTFSTTADKWFADVLLCGHGERGTEQYHGADHVTWYARPASGGVWQPIANGTASGTCPSARFYHEGSGTFWYEVRLRVQDDDGNTGTMDIEIGIYGLD